MNADGVHRMLREMMRSGRIAGGEMQERAAEAPPLHVTINVHAGAPVITLGAASCCARHEAAAEAPPGRRPRPACAEPADV